MSERELDSSSVEYSEISKPTGYIKQLEWDMAIGLQEVDNLKPSKYLEKLLDDNVNGIMTIDEVKESLRAYYVEKENNAEINHNELECDFVSTRIVELLQQDNFELSVDYLKYVHKYLFQDVYEFAGEFRKIDFSNSKGATLVFVEVKTLPSGNPETLEKELSVTKQKKIVKTSKCFLLEYRQYKYSYIRYDVVVVDMPGQEPIWHIENAFSEYS